MRTRQIWFWVVFILLLIGIARIARAGESDRQICDVRADYALGIEDYPSAIRLHKELVREHPNDALAHYHLGFAQGMVGNRSEEISEYERAAALGLKNWDLFLNLGLAQMQNDDLIGATDSLRQAVFLGEDHSESHFNLSLAYQRRGMLPDAESEMMASLRLNPDQPEARNTLGVIYAQEGKTVRASMVWRELMRDRPDYGPARRNLAVLASQNEAAVGDTAAIVPSPAAAVKVTEDERKLP